MPRSWIGSTASAVGVALLVGCSDDATGRDPSASSEGPLYAMMVQVYGPEDRSVYVALSDTLDIRSVSLDDAREFPGVANFAAIEGRLLISDGSQPKITEFDITSVHDWVEGRAIDFANYGLPEDGANFYGQFVIDPEHVLLPFGDGTQRILWDPSKMAIERSFEESRLVSVEPTLNLSSGGNRNAVQFTDGALQPFFYNDDDYYAFGSLSHVIAYDPKTFEEARILDIPCPELSQMTLDERGNTYVANWNLPVSSLTGEGAPMCVAKIASDHETFETIDLGEWTGGRIANNFRYVGGGKAIASVLHHEILGFSAPEKIDRELLEEEVWLGGPQWKLWLFDMDAGTAAPIEGIDVPVSAWFQFSVLDGRTFIFLPYDDYSRTKGYELASDGTAVEGFDSPGDVFKWVRVR